MKDVGLIIVNYNDAKGCLNLIDDVKGNKLIKEIVIVDNASTDDSVEVLKKYKNIHLIESEKNVGYAGAINKGAKYLAKNYKEMNVIISNSDIRIKEDVMSSLNEMIDEDHVCVMPKVKEGNTYAYGWKKTKAKVDLLMNIPLLNRIYKDSIKFYSNDYFKGIKEVDVIYGCFFMIDLDILKKIDYMDEHTFLYFEEYILATKLKDINKKSLINSDVYVTHEHNKTIGNNISDIDKYKIYKKSQFYYEKNYNDASGLVMVLLYFFYNITLLGKKIKSWLIKD